MTGSVIAVTILLASPSVVTGQPAEGRIPWVSLPECIAAPRPNAPFSAEALTVWHPSAKNGGAELRSTARYYRDRAGRVRVEFVGGLSPHRVMITPEADSPVAYLLDTVARTAIKATRMSLGMIVGGGCFDVVVLPLSMNRFVSFGGRPLDEESLGERLLAGVQVTGTRFNTMLPANVAGVARGERWISPELQLVVHSRREDSAIGVVEHRLSHISRAEPPAHLFEVSADYAETAGTCLAWESPYQPNASPVGSLRCAGFAGQPDSRFPAR